MGSSTGVPVLFRKRENKYLRKLSDFSKYVLAHRQQTRARLARSWWAAQLLAAPRPTLDLGTRFQFANYKNDPLGEVARRSVGTEHYKTHSLDSSFLAIFNHGL